MKGKVSGEDRYFIYFFHWADSMFILLKLIIGIGEPLKKNRRWCQIQFWWVLADLKHSEMRVSGPDKCLTPNSPRQLSSSSSWRRRVRKGVSLLLHFLSSYQLQRVELLFIWYIPCWNRGLRLFLFTDFHPTSSTGLGTEWLRTDICQMHDHSVSL